jgi:hypothetical protein
VTPVAFTAVELSCTVTEPTPRLAAVVNGRFTGAVSTEVDTARMWRPVAGPLPMPVAVIVTWSPGLTVMPLTVAVAVAPAEATVKAPPLSPVVSSASTQLAPLAGNVVPAAPVSLTVSPAARPLVATNPTV